MPQVENPVLSLVSVIVIIAVALVQLREWHIKREAWQMGREVKTLQDALLSATCRTIGLAGFAALVLNRLIFLVLDPVAVGVVGIGSIVVLALPAFAFVIRFRRHSYASNLSIEPPKDQT